MHYERLTTLIGAKILKVVCATQSSIFYKQEREISSNSGINTSQRSYSDRLKDTLMFLLTVDVSKETWILKPTNSKAARKQI
jgi:hypothetical protein